MITEAELTRVLDRFEKFMLKPNREIRCPLCLHPERIAINRDLLTHARTDRWIANTFGFQNGSVRHHRRDCLVTRGGANPRDVQSIVEQERKRFPATAQLP